MTTRSARPFWTAVLLAWLGVAAVICLTCAGDIARQNYPDPDDILRRLEVRDLLAGQSWWDVSQHRLLSGRMHWSRLVDLPLAAVILPLRFWLGELGAERVAMVVVPLVTLGAVLALAAALTRRLLDREHAWYAMLIAAMSVPLVCQLRPMRIDHHGWQVVCAMGALYAFVTGRGCRAGAIGGTLLAVLLTISLEGLPIVAALLGIVALAWAQDPRRSGQMVGATASTFLAALALHALTRGPEMGMPACDAMAPAWLAMLGVAALATAGATLTSGFGRAARIAALAVGGIATGATIFLAAPDCLAGPFGTLEPLVRKLWYDQVPEGLPVWKQEPGWAAMCMGLPLVALAGTAMALRRAQGDRRERWLIVLAAQVASLLLAVMVSRAGATAHAFALPGGSVVLLAALNRARAVRRPLPRVAATAGALLLASPAWAALPLLMMRGEQITSAAHSDLVGLGRTPCTSMDDVRALAALPPALMFAPLDIAPDLIAATSHRAITSGHHRNHAAMRDVILAFIAAPDNARRIIQRYRPDYLVACPGANEMAIYHKLAPNGLWARLERGERVPWLQPVPFTASPVLIWRVLPSSAPRR